MNEEMNNNYNNTPNYNYEKNNGGVKVLLIILIILVLCLIGLTCYKMFIYDKKNDNNKDNNVVENNNKPSNVENQNIIDDKKDDVNDIEKYYDYVSLNGLFTNYDSSNNPIYDYDYLNNNKNFIAYNKVIIKNENKYIKSDKCSNYLNDIMKRNDGTNYICYTLESEGMVTCGDKEYNSNPNTKVYTLSSDDLKNAVETIYGKDSYKPSTFNIGGLMFYHYVESKDTYIALDGCGGGTGPHYVSKLLKSEKDNNYLYLYEEVKSESLDDDKTLINVATVKHTFEKNLYDDNYHYVKTEKV